MNEVAHYVRALEPKTPWQLVAGAVVVGLLWWIALHNHSAPPAPSGTPLTRQEVIIDRATTPGVATRRRECGYGSDIVLLVPEAGRCPPSINTATTQ